MDSRRRCNGPPSESRGEDRAYGVSAETAEQLDRCELHMELEEHFGVKATEQEWKVIDESQTVRDTIDALLKLLKS